MPGEKHPGLFLHRVGQRRAGLGRAPKRPLIPCRSGGTGRRAGFRVQWRMLRRGSNPRFGTSKSRGLRSNLKPLFLRIRSAALPPILFPGPMLPPIPGIPPAIQISLTEGHEFLVGLSGYQCPTAPAGESLISIGPWPAHRAERIPSEEIAMSVSNPPGIPAARGWPRVAA